MMRYPVVIWALIFTSLAVVNPVESQTPGTPSGTGDRTSGLGLSRDYNPAVGANLLLGGEYLSSDSESWLVPETLKEQAGQNGIRFFEAELAAAAAVDPYFRADLIVAFHRHGREFHVDVEEGMVTTLSLPLATIRAGKFLLPFGRHNQLHSHSFPFVDAPLPNRLFLGEEGLNEAAVEVALLLPLSWFVEMTGWAANGDNETLFDSADDKDLAFGGRLRTMVELSEATTVEMGGSYTGGKGRAGGWTHMWGADMTLKWRHPRLSRYYGLTWQTEYMQVRRGGPRPGMVKEGEPGFDADLVQASAPGGLGGGYTFLAAQVAQRFWVQGRFDALGYPRGEGGRRLHRASGLLAFVPTEFSAMRLQYSYWNEPDSHEVLLQLSVSIGAHPAHGY